MRALKLGDELYSESLQKIAPVYRRAFPQRETQLYGRFREIEVVKLSHQRLLQAETRASVAAQVQSYLNVGDFDLVDNPLSVLALDHRVRTPIVFDCIDWYAEMYAAEFDDPAGAEIVRSCFEECVRRSTAVVAQSPLMLRAVWEVQRPPRSLVIPNGYDEALFRPLTPAEVESARRCIEADQGVSLRGRRVITYTGKIGEWYRGLVNLIEALDPARDLLLLVGDGPLLDELQHVPHVVRCGVVPLAKVPLYTNAADVLAFPLGVDCSPIVLSEYLAVGRPIVAPRGRIEWLLRDGVSGAVVDDTPAGWRNGIERAAGMTRTAAAANRRLARGLGWGQLAARFERFLVDVVASSNEAVAAHEVSS